MSANISKIKQHLQTIESFDLSEDERDILLYSFMLKRGLQGMLVQVLDAAQDRARCNQNLNAALAMVKGPAWGMCQHGVIQRLEAKFDDGERSEVARLLRMMSDLLRDKLNIQAFVTSGTLLGLVREGGFLAHDFDFDMAYISNMADEDAICDERRSVVDAINASGVFEIRGVFTDKVQVHFKVGEKLAYMDLFVSFQKNGYFNEAPLRPNYLPYDQVSPLKTMSLYGHEVFVPRNPEKLLEINYGPSWRTPDPSYRFDFGEHAKHYWFLHKKPVEPK